MAAPHAEARTDPRSIRVLLAENLELLRTALVSVLSEQADMEVVADLACDRAVVAVATRLCPDVAVVAADPPEAGGLFTVHELHHRLPDCRIVALTAPKPPGLVQRLLAEDIPGLVDKNAPAARLLAAIRGVAAGGSVIDPTLVAAARAAGRNPFTPRELHVLRLAAGGASGPEIATTLCLANGTVRNYLSSAMAKTGARTRIDAIRIAGEAGWL